jgi:predicted DNA-binding ribbon-helix-helix protein
MSGFTLSRSPRNVRILIASVVSLRTSAKNQRFNCFNETGTMGVGNKRSIKIAGHNTGINIEDAFWKALKEIAAARGHTVSKLVSMIDSARHNEKNLSSAVRVYVLEYYRSQERK